MKTQILSIVLIVLIAISVPAMAQQKQAKRDRNPEQKERMMRQRDSKHKQFSNFFTEEQKEQVKALRLEMAKQVKPLHNQLGELKAKQHTLTTADKADLNAINKNIDKMSELQAEIQKLRAKQHQKIRSLLTDEQLIKFDAMKRHHKNKNKQHRPHKGQWS